MLPRALHLFPKASLCFILLFIFSCGSKADYAGLYKASEGQTKKQTEIELKEDGEGIWRVEDNEESFTWYLKGGEIRLNTKGGGVLVAEIQDNTLRITLPGGKKILFKKVK